MQRREPNAPGRPFIRKCRREAFGPPESAEAESSEFERNGLTNGCKAEPDRNESRVSFALDLGAGIWLTLFTQIFRARAKTVAETAFKKGANWPGCPLAMIGGEGRDVEWPT